MMTRRRNTLGEIIRASAAVSGGFAALLAGCLLPFVLIGVGLGIIGWLACLLAPFC